jgi:hypothetical protein
MNSTGRAEPEQVIIKLLFVRADNLGALPRLATVTAIERYRTDCPSNFESVPHPAGGALQYLFSGYENEKKRSFPFHLDIHVPWDDAFFEGHGESI